MINRPVITLDMDGVIADTGYIPPENRNDETYRKLSPATPTAVLTVNQLAEKYNVYIVSARSFPGALDCTRDWLGRMGVKLDKLAGVITGVVGKGGIVNQLCSEFHFDDHPDECQSVARLVSYPEEDREYTRSVLVHVPGWINNEKYYNAKVFRTVKSIDLIPQFLKEWLL